MSVSGYWTPTMVYHATGEPCVPPMPPMPPGKFYVKSEAIPGHPDYKEGASADWPLDAGVATHLHQFYGSDAPCKAEVFQPGGGGQFDGGGASAQYSGLDWLGVAVLVSLWVQLLRKIAPPRPVGSFRAAEGRRLKDYEAQVKQAQAAARRER